MIVGLQEGVLHFLSQVDEDPWKSVTGVSPDCRSATPSTFLLAHIRDMLLRYMFSSRAYRAC